MNNQRKETGSEREKRQTRRRRGLLLWAVGGTLALLLSIIVSQQLWLWTVIRPDTASDTLVLYALSTLNFAAFIVFSFIFIRSLLKLRRERNERQLGSKIKTRLLVHFIAISFLPITAMAVFSYLFLNRSLEKWFSPFPEGVVQEAREVQRESLAEQNRSLREMAALVCVLLNKQPDSTWQQTLDEVVANGRLSAMEIVSEEGEVKARSEGNLPADERSELEALLEKARQSGGSIGESLADGKGFDVISVPLTENENLVLAPLRRSDTNLSDINAGSQSEYQKLVKKQRKVRLLGLSTLGLMTLMLLFVSAWVAIYLARGIATPIKALAEASNEIASGNLSHRVTTFAEDELALLAHSFNQMTAQLEENRRHIETGAAELREKNLALEERRNYIETVLESLSTGVISLDENDRVTTINAAAARMLPLNKNPAGSDTIQELVVAEDRIVFDRLLKRARRTGQAAEQTQLAGRVAHESSSIPVALTATALRGSAKGRRGVVLVIEDLSELLAAQRAAAWSEVARRMAHEIKNPLTPIQLSAERIAKNYRSVGANGRSGGDGNGSRAQSEEPLDDERVTAVIDECTQTIAREVAGLKAMVDEFSRFARLPLARLKNADLNEVVLHAVALYEGRLDGVKIETKLDPTLPSAMLDAEQLRRVFVNLIENALAALADMEGERIITITTTHDVGQSSLIAQIADTGHGIQAADFRRLFQPYFSTRGSGTGLGLAIVQRIILEHRGRIRAETNSPRGARFVIELPATNA
jgi:two-component system, NtrC family, nitrogen regulation sensor histidine kinase NtrY